MVATSPLRGVSTVSFFAADHYTAGAAPRPGRWFFRGLGGGAFWQHPGRHVQPALLGDRDLVQAGVSKQRLSPRWTVAERSQRPGRQVWLDVPENEVHTVINYSHGGLNPRGRFHLGCTLICWQF